MGVMGGKGTFYSPLWNINLRCFSSMLPSPQSHGPSHTTVGEDLHLKFDSLMLLETSLTHPSCPMSCIRRGHRVLVLASSQWQHGEQPAILLWTGGGSWGNFRVLLYFHLYYSPRSPAEFPCTAYRYKRLCSSCCIFMLLTNSYLFTECFFKVTKSAVRFLYRFMQLKRVNFFCQIIYT